MNPSDTTLLKREYVHCALCGEENATIQYKINTQEIKFSRVWIDGVERQVRGTETLVACKTCGLVYVNPRLVRTSAVSTYSIEEEMAYFNGTKEARRMAFRRLTERMPFWLGRDVHSLLDLGCGDGTLLEAAREVGIESVGTEVSEPLVRLVRERLGGLAIFSGNLENLVESYDVVTLINVIEHVEDPRAILETAVRLLKPDGIFLVHTINLGGLPAKMSGARWYHIEPFNHLYYFTDQTLVRLLRQAGLEPISRFSLVISRGVKGTLQRLLEKSGIYLDNGLGVVARHLR